LTHKTNISLQFSQNIADDTAQ